MYWIVKKKTAERWVAYDLPKRPGPERGYEIRGLYKSLLKAWMGTVDAMQGFNRDQR